MHKSVDRFAFREPTPVARFVNARSGSEIRPGNQSQVAPCWHAEPPIPRDDDGRQDRKRSSPIRGNAFHADGDRPSDQKTWPLLLQAAAVQAVSGALLENSGAGDGAVAVLVPLGMPLAVLPQRRFEAAGTDLFV